MKLLGCVRERLKRSLFFNLRRPLSYYTTSPGYGTYRCILLIPPIIYRVKRRNGDTVFFEVYQKVDEEDAKLMTAKDRQTINELISSELSVYLDIYMNNPIIRVVVLYEDWMDTIRGNRK